MKHKLLIGWSAGMGMVILILDAKTALSGAAEGIRLCLQTVIPSLFPFLFLSILLTQSLNAVPIPFPGILRRWMCIPKGGEYLYWIGMLGGYPVGAQSIALACRQGKLSPFDAARMLPFCNNAGPAFLFGMGAVLFEDWRICLLLWLIVIISSLLLGIITAPGKQEHFISDNCAPPRFSNSMAGAVKSMAQICGWVVLFRVMLCFGEQWIFWLLPETGQVILSGLLEITNGCCKLSEIQPMGLRFLLMAVFLGFGGICVTLQTSSVISETDITMTEYCRGKLLQGCICLLLSVAAQPIFPPESRYVPGAAVIALCGGICILCVILRKKSKKDVAFPGNVVYNQEKSYI